MKWVKKFSDNTFRMAEWTLEDASLSAYVFRSPNGEYQAHYLTGSAKFEASATPEFVLGEVQKTLVHDLRKLASRLSGKTIPVENEPSPVEIIPGSEGKAGYGYGWLRVRKDREVPPSYRDNVLLDDGRFAHIHPFINAGSRKLAEVLSVSPDTYVAGIRWFSDSVALEEKKAKETHGITAEEQADFIDSTIPKDENGKDYYDR